MRMLSLKWRIGTYTAVVLCIAISVISVIAYQEFKEAMLDSLDYRLQSDTNAIQNVIQEVGSLDSARSEIMAIARSKTNPYHSSYRIWFEEDDQWINSNENIDAMLAQIIEANPKIEWKDGFFDTDFVDNEKPLRLIWAKYPIQFENETTPRQLNIFGSISASFAYHEMDEFLQALLIIAAVVILAGITGLFLVLRWGLQPLAQIIDKMEDFSGHLFTSPAMNINETVKELRPFVKSWNQMLKRLSIAIDENKRFTADASHELRTPLAVIKSTLQLARSQKRTPDFYENAIDESLEDLDRMNRLIEKLLELSRLDSILLSETFKPIDMKQLTENVVELYQPIAEHHKKTIQLKLCQANIQGNQIQLELLLKNLLDNAIRYAPGHSEISVNMKIDNDNVKITVHDQGGAISPQDQVKIFDRFYRIDEARDRKSGGAGLGLSIAYEIAQQHNGMISVTSSPDAGTDFIITLPVSQK